MSHKSFLIRSFLIAFSLTLLLLGTSCTSMPEGNPDNGERWFRMNRCNGCHGEQGSGGIGPNGQKGPTIAGLELSYSKFINKLRNPNSAIMPAFDKDLVSNKDAADIYLWLQNQKRQ